MLRICVNFPCLGTPTAFASRIGQFPLSRRRQHTCFAYVSIPLLNSFCRLAATSANKVPRPSNYSIATATGSKRSSADSDLLLCHIRLRRTSRFRFGCGTGCKHSEMGFILIVPSAHGLNSRPRHSFSAGVQTMRARICSAFSCDVFARVVV